MKNSILNCLFLKSFVNTVYKNPKLTPLVNQSQFLNWRATRLKSIKL